MNRPHTVHLAAAVALASALAGCRDPYRASATSPVVTSTRPAAADTEALRRRPPAATVSRSVLAPSARVPTAAFARAWVNWDWRTVAAHQRALARMAIGSLAAELQANARTASADASLVRDRPSSRGTVVASDLHSDRGRVAAIVVTSEQTYTDGHADLGGLHYRVYRTVLVRAKSGWAVSRWAPLP